MKVNVGISAIAKYKAIEKINWAMIRMSSNLLSVGEMVAFGGVIVDQMLKLKPGWESKHPKYIVHRNSNTSMLKPYTLEVIDNGIIIPFADTELMFLKSFFSDGD